jgi:hypothetical protein
VEATRLRGRPESMVARHRGGPPGWQARYVAGLVAADAVAAMLGAGSGFVARFGEVSVHNQVYVSTFVLLPVCWALTLAMNGGYESRHLFVGTTEYQRVARAGIALTASVALVSYAFELPISRVYVLIALPVTVLATVAFRFGTPCGRGGVASAGSS